MSEHERQADEIKRLEKFRADVAQALLLRDHPPLESDLDIHALDAQFVGRIRGLLKK